jgi:acyl-CoA synthetase (AMP-forming)/AMP-acid ligase II
VKTYSNIADALAEQAAARPHTPAIHVPVRARGDGVPEYRSYTYAELNQATIEIASGLAHIGLTPGTRAAVLVRPSFELFALTFGLFRAGIIPVLIDPGIGVKRMGACLKQAEVEAFIGIPAAHVARCVLGWGRGSVTHLITVGALRLWSGHTLRRVQELGRASPTPSPATQPDDPAAILFTSGSTGAPKGVVYRVRHFLAQIEMIRNAYGIEPGEIDLPTFPLFALFDPALGMTTVVPLMDPTRPAEANPRILAATINAFQVTNMFGSPALLNTLGRYLNESQTRLNSVQRVISAGAAVSPMTVERVMDALPSSARLHTPYGATECLPVSTVHSGTILNESRPLTEGGAGVCVGTVVAPNDVNIIEISDEPIADWCDVKVLAPGQIGEITVRGPTTTQRYYGLSEATDLSKIRHGQQAWLTHRMGDVGYFDDAGKLWFCGRKAHRVMGQQKTYYTVPVESVLNVHPDVFRTALVGVAMDGDVRPIVCVELEKSPGKKWGEIVDDLHRLAAMHDVTRDVQHFLPHPKFPVDIRHNAKIGREELSVWAQRQLR